MTSCNFLNVNPIHDGHFSGCSWMGRVKRPPLPKICHTYPTLMKLGTVIPHLKKIQKIYESFDTPPDFCWHQHFFTGIFSQHFFISVFSSAKMSTRGLPKITVFWNKGYDVIISFNDVTKKLFTTWYKLYCRCVHVTKVW